MIKSSVVPAAPQEAPPKFPCLMQSTYTGRVVLFSGPKVGVMVAQGHSEIYVWNVGDHDKDWEMSNFEEFTGSVTLENSK